LGPYLKQFQSAEYVLPSSKKALINDRLDTSVAMVGGPRLKPVKAKLQNGDLEVMVDRKSVLYVEPMIYYRRVKANRGESFEFES
jgi:hypothetical protein